ncbi:lipoprotein signal peptidase [Wandonia haliotis]|uniref:Lipoprotein signal peptidase n=1 Tax=Wandonia haliotis TaxID=574963 RepID=A0ABP3Y5W2_9FLAO
MNKKAIIAVVLILGILIVDQVVKVWIKTTFELHETVNVFGDWFRLMYIENQGMAFGTTLGSGSWAKLALSIFRLLAISGLIYYLIKQLRNRSVRTEYIVAISLVLAGATGNLIDSAVYDYVFEFDPSSPFNWVLNSEGEYVMRKQGFLFANVVDMFQFNARWPEWVPWLGGEDVFGAIWNVADAAITCGVIMILIRQRTYFPSSGKKKKEDKNEEPEVIQE